MSFFKSLGFSLLPLVLLFSKHTKAASFYMGENHTLKYDSHLSITIREISLFASPRVTLITKSPGGEESSFTGGVRKDKPIRFGVGDRKYELSFNPSWFVIGENFIEVKVTRTDSQARPDCDDVDKESSLEGLQDRLSYLNETPIRFKGENFSNDFSLRRSVFQSFCNLASKLPGVPSPHQGYQLFYEEGCTWTTFNDGKARWIRLNMACPKTAIFPDIPLGAWLPKGSEVTNLATTSVTEQLLDAQVLKMVEALRTYFHTPTPKTLTSDQEKMWIDQRAEELLQTLLPHHNFLGTMAAWFSRGDVAEGRKITRSMKKAFVQLQGSGIINGNEIEKDHKFIALKMGLTRFNLTSERDSKIALGLTAFLACSIAMGKYISIVETGSKSLLTGGIADIIPGIMKGLTDHRGFIALTTVGPSAIVVASLSFSDYFQEEDLELP